MDQKERRTLLHRIAVTIGDKSFNQLLGSVKAVRLERRLRFWQEDLLKQAQVVVSDYTGFLELFDGAEWRETGRSKDALTAATTSYLVPVLREHGFKKYGKRSFGRLMNDCIFQYIDLQLSAYGSKSFAVNYASTLITRLQETLGSSTWRRLPRGKSNDGWWEAIHHERADESMLDVHEKIVNIAFPWFDSTATTQGLSKELAMSTEHGNPHAFFELGCCYATAGDLDAAGVPLQEAILLFQKSYDEMPQRTWALSQQSLAEKLVVAIADGNHADLLSSWQEQSVVNLKLSAFRARDRSK